jgi:hypothetical protein
LGRNLSRDGYGRVPTSTNHTTASRLLTESYSRCNRPGATPDRSRTDGAPLQVYVSPGAGGVGEPRPGGRRAGRRWHSWECLAPACENLFLTTETAHILRDDETASRLLTESYSRCNRPGATPGLTTETAHILRDDETASLLLTVSYSRATKAPTPWHTRLHPDTSRSKISEQQCLAGPGSPHNDRSDGKPNSSWPGLPPQRQKFNKSKYDTNMTFAKFNNVC